ncbi:MAG: phosphate ABC transporter substrate-binding protein [Pseudomonadota bacterium]|nr:phosphate ABC transporter substrate-binding protein [Pseudomonadota bacterium]
MRLLKPIMTGTLGLVLGAAPAMADSVAVVSSKSPVMTLNKVQVADIFLGKTNRFPAGGPAVPIDLKEGSAVRDEFYAKIADKSPAQLKAYWSKIIFTGRGQPPPAVSSSTDMKKRVAANPAAIGYIERDLVDASVRVVF